YAEVAAGAGRRGRVHGEQVADGQEGELGAVDLAEELHVGEERRVPGVVEGEAARKLDDVAGGETAVEDLVAVGDAARVVGAHHGDGEAEDVLAAAEVHRRAALHPLRFQPAA